MNLIKANKKEIVLLDDEIAVLQDSITERNNAIEDLIKEGSRMRGEQTEFQIMELIDKKKHVEREKQALLEELGLEQKTLLTKDEEIMRLIHVNENGLTDGAHANLYQNVLELQQEIKELKATRQEIGTAIMAQQNTVNDTRDRLDTMVELLKRLQSDKVHRELLIGVRHCRTNGGNLPRCKRGEEPPDGAELIPLECYELLEHNLVALSGRQGSLQNAMVERQEYLDHITSGLEAVRSQHATLEAELRAAERNAAGRRKLVEDNLEQLAQALQTRETMLKQKVYRLKREAGPSRVAAPVRPRTPGIGPKTPGLSRPTTPWKPVSPGVGSM